MSNHDHESQRIPSSPPEERRPYDAIPSGISRFSSALCALAMIAMAVGVTVEIISRNFFGHSFRSVEELSGYLIVAITFFSLVVAVYEKALFRVEFLFERFPRPVRRVMDILFLIALMVFLGLIDYQSAALVVGSYQNGYVSSTLLATPLYIPQALVPLGLTLTLVLVLFRLIDRIRNGVEDDDEVTP